jgi:hypothetical protein
MEPHPDKAMVAVDARMAKGRNVVKFISGVYWILDTKLRESEHL